MEGVNPRVWCHMAEEPGMAKEIICEQHNYNQITFKFIAHTYQL